jgi:predicted metalloprotease with PDZ domain
MKTLCLGLLLACSASGVAYGEPTRVAYTLELVRGEVPRVQVSIRVAGEPDGTSRFEVTPSWGGIDHCERFVGRLRATGPDAGSLDVSQVAGTPTAWEIVHAPGAEVTFTYDVTPSEKDALGSFGTHYEPVVRPDLVHLIGDTCLAYPAWLEKTGDVEADLEWKGFDAAGWRTTSSFDSEALTRTMPLETFRHALFIGAPEKSIRVVDREVKGRTVRVAVLGDDWGFSADEMADLVARIVGAEREFVDDFEDLYFLVSVTPIGRRPEGRSFSMGGTGLTNCFALFLVPGTAIGDAAPHRDRILHLLAHEYFHTWNGGKLRTEDPEELVYWFSEGFTDYFASRLLRRAGLIDDARWAGRLNETIARLWRSPVRNEPATTIQKEFWSRREVQDLPYARGECVAVLLDAEIRRASNNERCLDDFVREIILDARTGTRAGTDDLLRRVERWTSAPVAAAIRRVVVDGGLPEMPASIADPACARRDEETFLYEAGFDVEETIRTRVVAGVVQDSAAHRAGVRDGQRLAGISIARGDPEQSAMVRVTDAEGTRELKFMPRGTALVVPRYRLNSAPEAPRK